MPWKTEHPTPTFAAFKKIAAKAGFNQTGTKLLYDYLSGTTSFDGRNFLAVDTSLMDPRFLASEYLVQDLSLLNDASFERFRASCEDDGLFTPLLQDGDHILLQVA